MVHVAKLCRAGFAVSALMFGAAAGCTRKEVPTELQVFIDELDHIDVIAPATMFVGGSNALTIKAFNEDNTVYTLATTTTYVSSDPAIAIVDGAVVRAISTKDAASQPVIITATAKSVSALGIAATATKSITITVQRSLASISLGPIDKSSQVGESYQLQVTPTSVPGAPANLTPSYAYVSATPSVATVDAGGKVTAVGAGTTTLRASADGITSNDAKLTVTAAAAAPPTIILSATSQQVQAGLTADVIARVTNASGTSPVQWSSKDPTIVTVGPANTAAIATGAPTTLTAVKAGGPVDVVATYTARGTTVTATVAVTVVAAPSASVTTMYLDPIAAEYTPTAGNFYRARLFDAQGNEVAASADGGTIVYGSNNATVIAIDASSGLSTAKIDGSTAITAKYVKGGLTIATAPPSPVTVYTPKTPGHFGALQISLAGDVRKIKVGQTVQFQVIVRNTDGIQVLPTTSTGVRSQLAVTSSSSAALVIADDPATTGFYYTMRAIALPSSSAVPGIANVVTVKADITGAMITIPMAIVP